MPIRHGAIEAKNGRIFERLSFRFIAEPFSPRKPCAWKKPLPKSMPILLNSSMDGLPVAALQRPPWHLMPFGRGRPLHHFRADFGVFQELAADFPGHRQSRGGRER